MSNPTTPFSWQMPQNTDLVTDLPADFEVFGQAVATSMADLLGGTTGQVLAKTTATDMDFTWTTPQVGDITGVTAGTGISGGGTSGTVTVTNSMATAITTNGDLIYGTGSGTFNRLGIGTTGQVLTVTGGIPSYATPTSGGMTLLSTTTLSGASVTISSISGIYNNLFIIVQGVTNATASGALRIAPNGSTTITSALQNANTTVSFDQTNGAYMRLSTTSFNPLFTDANNVWAINIYNYANATNYKAFDITGNWIGAPATEICQLSKGAIKTNSAITSLVFTNAGGNLSTGTVLIYGVK